MDQHAFRSVLHRRAGSRHVTDAELALAADGIFLGLRVKIIANLGAYLQAGMPAFVGNRGILAGCLSHARHSCRSTAVFTHTNPVRPYRGNGRPEAAYVIERLVDLAADQLAIDPAELRRRNYIPPDAMPFNTGLTFTYDCGDFERNMDYGARSRGCRGIRGAPSGGAQARQAPGIRHLQYDRAGRRPGFEGAEIRFDRSGTVTLLTGAITQGQGHETVFKQILCDRLGLDPREVHYVQGDTDKVAFGEGTAARADDLGGSAFHLAVEKIVTKAKRIAAQLLAVESGEI